MAVYGVIADIHGNREALAAVLDCCDRRGIDGLICLGDIVGYNADSESCVAMLKSRQAIAIAGNHDLISVGQLGFDRCSNKAAYSLKRTRGQLTHESAAYLKSLPAHRVIDNRILLVHAGIRDVQQYLATSSHIRQNADYMRMDFPNLSICMFGHVHTQKVYEVEGAEICEVQCAQSLVLREDCLYFINPGAVDAARKQDNRLAEFAIIDSTALKLEFHSVVYDHHASEARAEANGYRIGPWMERFYSLRRRLISNR